MATGSCGKFEANIFNKNKCQNCFKSREVHPLNDGELEQAKPVYAGWLCLAPVGTDFDNPMQRSRKWQRRFFILYEHGSLTYALDELSSTLPQGTVNMNLCTNVTDGESRTGQRNALCIVTPGQEMFIRSDNKEIINGWSEQLTVYLQTNKQNQKKKRKVDPVALQYPCPAKMAATGRSWPSMKAGSADVHHWGRELHAAGPDVTPAWTVTHKDPEWSPAGGDGDDTSPACTSGEVEHLGEGSGPSLSCPASDGAGRLGGLASSQDLAAAGRCNQLTDLIDAQKSANSQNQRRYGSLDRPAEELLRGEAAISRQGRPDAQSREKLLSAADSSQLSFPHPQRRAKSLDRRTSDTAMTPDVLTFKKGWMIKLDKDDEWKKHWFVLSTASLRYYKDSVAEESSDLEGEINLTKCYSVSEYEVQRNYGFQIHTQKAVYTLSAMTAGIRNNWIQSLKKYVNPANAPDVDSLPGRHITCRPPEVIPKPDVTHDSVPNNLSAIEDPAKPRNVTKIRHEGRSKIFDWFEFGSENQCTVDAALCSLEMGDSERWRRREERRRRYESLLGFSLQKPEGRAMQVQQTMAERIAECWRQVEKTPLRPERTVRLSAQGRDSLEMDNLLQGCREVVNDLKAQLADSERRRLQLEAHLSTARSFPEPDVPVLSKGVSHPADVNLTPLKDLNGSDVLQHQKDLPPEPSSLSPQLSSIWMHDIDKERDGLLFVAPTSDGQHDIFQGDGGIMGSSCDSHNHFQLPHNTEKIIFEQKKSEGRDDIFKNHVATDQSVMKRLSHEVELLTRQNQALNQRNQEMVNQLTEADREIEKLKVELGNRYTEPHHLPEVEQQENIKLEDLERQLILRSQELHEALMLISSLEGSLRDTEVLLQLKHAAETNTSGKGETKTNAEKTELLRCLDATEIKLTELKRQLEQSELTCRKLEHQNMELKEAEELYRPKATEAEANKKRMTEEKREEEERNQNIPAQEKIQQVVEGAVTRLQALRKLLELIDSLDLAEETEEEQQDENAAVLGQLRWEESFWKSVLNKLKNDPQQLKEPPVDPLYEVVKGLILEKQMMLAGHELLLHAEETSECGLEKCKRSASKDVNFIGEPEMAPGLETGGEEINCRSGINDQLKNLKAVTEKKISSLKLLAASSINSLGLDRLLPAADRLYSFYLSPHSSSISLIHSAATEAFCCCLSGRLQSKYQRRICPSCVALEEQNEMLQTRMSALEKLSSSEGAKISTGCQTDERAQQLTEAELQSSGGGDVEDMIDMEQNESGIPLRMQNTGLDGSDEEDSDMKTQRIFDLRAEVGELEEQPKLKEDFDEKMNCVQEQHEREIAKLKATWECGLVAMEDCHLRVVVELQHLHQQEVERLLVERERLLEEESAATATTIKAIKSAHRAELQREIQKRSRSENGNGNPQLEEIHREELASFEREFDVLSHQFSMKCLENTHLVQALDAERKALCQCQQENQDLRNRNQELSGHLAGEITRLCFLAKRDQLPPGQRMDAYETEIMLRMKESEVQCLKLGVASLKDELQAGVKDKTIATKNYKDVHGELSIIRAKAEQEAEELRENLRLTHQALGETST